MSGSTARRPGDDPAAAVPAAADPPPAEIPSEVPDGLDGLDELDSR